MHRLYLPPRADGSAAPGSAARTPVSFQSPPLKTVVVDRVDGVASAPALLNKCAVYRLGGFGGGGLVRFPIRRRLEIIANTLRRLSANVSKAFWPMAVVLLTAVYHPEVAGATSAPPEPSTWAMMAYRRRNSAFRIV